MAKKLKAKAPKVKKIAPAQKPGQTITKPAPILSKKNDNSKNGHLHQPLIDLMFISLQNKFGEYKTIKGEQVLQPASLDSLRSICSDKGLINSDQLDQLGVVNFLLGMNLK